MTRAQLAAAPRYRKLQIEKSVLLALADRNMHGPVIKDNFLAVAAKYANRCDDCGLQLELGQLVVHGERPGLQPNLWVHARCPRPNLFELMPWLTRWEGADVVSGWFALEKLQRCSDCRRLPRGPEDLFALVRRPGPMVRGHQHSDYKCRECVKL